MNPSPFTIPGAMEAANLSRGAVLEAAVTLRMVGGPAELATATALEVLANEVWPRPIIVGVDPAKPRRTRKQFIASFILPFVCLAFWIACLLALWAHWLWAAIICACLGAGSRMLAQALDPRDWWGSWKKS